MGQKQSVVQYLLAYLLWLISSTLGFAALYFLRETIVLGIVVASQVGQADQTQQFYQSLRVRAATHWTILLLGILLIMMLVAIEHIYRSAVPLGRLWERFFLVSAVEFAVLLAAHGIYYLLYGSFGSVGITGVLVPLAEAAFAGLFYWLWNNNRGKPVVQRL